MHNKVFFANGLKHVAAKIAHPFGKARIERGKQQIGAFFDNQLRQISLPQKPVKTEHVFFINAQFINHQRRHFVIHFGVNRKADHRTPAAAFERAFKRAHQVFGFFVNFHF